MFKSARKIVECRTLCGSSRSLASSVSRRAITRKKKRGQDKFLSQGAKNHSETCFTKEELFIRVKNGGSGGGNTI